MLTNNQILKNMIGKIYKGQKNEFKKLLHVNIENCEPINVIGQRYKKEWENNYFYYLDEEFRLIMVLKGVKFQRDYEYMGIYPRDIPWNRKNIEPLATYILMITPEMRQQYKPKNNARHNNIDYKRELMKRLNQYKAQKNSVITHEQMKTKIQECMQYFTEHMFEGEKFAKQFKLYSLFDGDMMEVSRDFLSDARGYINNYERYEHETEKYKNNPEWSIMWSSYYGDYISYKNRILTWEKKIKAAQNILMAV